MRVATTDAASARVAQTKQPVRMRDLRGLSDRDVERVVNSAMQRVVRADPAAVRAMNAATLDKSRPHTADEIRQCVQMRMRIASKIHKAVVKDLRKHGIDARKGPKETQLVIGRRVVEGPKHIDDPFAMVEWLVSLILALTISATIGRAERFLDAHRKDLLKVLGVEAAQARKVVRT